MNEQIDPEKQRLVLIRLLLHVGIIGSVSSARSSGPSLKTSVQELKAPDSAEVAVEEMCNASPGSFMCPRSIVHPSGKESHAFTPFRTGSAFPPTQTFLAPRSSLLRLVPRPCTA